MSSNPKEKGSSNERKLSRQLSLWFTHGESDDIFWRSANSGGAATVRSKKKMALQNAYGDISSTCIEGEPLLRITTWEAKIGYTDKLDLMTLIDGKGNKHLYKKFWLQTKEQAKEAAKAGWGSIPVLITQRDYKYPCISIPLYFFNDIEDYCGKLQTGKVRIIFTNDYEDIIIFKLQDFLDWVDPEYFKVQYEQIQTLKNYGINTKRF